MRTREALGPFLALFLIVIFFGVADWATGRDTFFTLVNLRTVSLQTCVVAVAALGMTVIIISGGIDLSIGSAIALAATVLAWGIHNDAALLLTSGSSFRSSCACSICPNRRGPPKPRRTRRAKT